MMKRFFSCTLAIVFACTTSVVYGGHGRLRDKGPYLNVEATYLSPIYDNAPVSFTLIDVPGATGVTIGSDFDTAEELTGAPRITFGLVGKRGIGIQARYWELNNSVTTNELPDPILGNQIQSLGGDDGFEAYTVDLELTKEFCRRGWNLLGTFGVRYADSDRGRVNRVTGFVNGDAYTLGSLQNVSFHGTGLTFSLNGLKPLNRCRCLSFYTSMRGSTVFGSAETTAITYASVVTPLATALQINGAIDDNDETMFIGEIQAGLQWSRHVRSFNGRMFARAGVEYQYWGTSDGFALSLSNVGNPGVSDGTAIARGGEQETQLIGLAISTGFAW